MMDFPPSRLDPDGAEVLPLSTTGSSLLTSPHFNKGSAFTEQERRDFRLLGLLPPHVSTIEEQLERRYQDYQTGDNDLERHIYLRTLQDRNEVLFYRLLQEHIREMMPIIYTPVVGLACQRFSHIYRQPRGLFIPYPQRHDLDSILANRPWRDVDVIVVTDGERILGLGDQGVGGMGIPVGKLSLYTLCGGIHPARTLPILLDAGTDNMERRNDPLYLGWRHERVRGQEYDDFVEAFVTAVSRAMPGVLLQWEDFAQRNARRLLDRYRDRICSFNDDIQGTAAVTLAAILAACRSTGLPFRDQRVVFFGAGSAGTGISDLLVTAMTREGLTESEALSRLWLVDRQGLLHERTPQLQPFQRRYVQPWSRVAEWPGAADHDVTLLDVVRNAKPTVLIGTSGQPNAFTGDIVRAMAKQVERPVIFPLSNPTSNIEANPADLAEWAGGRAIIATGSPFPGIAQCNNSYVFPGLGLGVIAAGARRVTDEMFLAAAHALASVSPAITNPDAPLFPPLPEIRSVSRRIAIAVAEVAQRQGLATRGEEPEQLVAARIWEPRYPRLERR